MKTKDQTVENVTAQAAANEVELTKEALVVESDLDTVLGFSKTKIGLIAGLSATAALIPVILEEELNILNVSTSVISIGAGVGMAIAMTPNLPMKSLQSMTAFSVGALTGLIAKGVTGSIGDKVKGYIDNRDLRAEQELMMAEMSLAVEQSTALDAIA